MSTITAVRAKYAGTWFASTLEADWAATFDSLGWHWQYEPVAVKLSNGESYRPDFYLPTQRVWAEVKGPHNERIVKPELLQEALGYDEWEWASELVVILRPPGPGETACWHGAVAHQDVVLVECKECQHFSFMDDSGLWACRRHIATPQARQDRKSWQGAIYRPSEVPFVRAPRPRRRAT